MTERRNKKRVVSIFCVWALILLSLFFIIGSKFYSFRETLDAAWKSFLLFVFLPGFEVLLIILSVVALVAVTKWLGKIAPYKRQKEYIKLKEKEGREGIEESLKNLNWVLVLSVCFFLIPSMFYYAVFLNGLLRMIHYQNQGDLLYLALPGYGIGTLWGLLFGFFLMALFLRPIYLLLLDKKQYDKFIVSMSARYGYDYDSRRLYLLGILFTLIPLLLFSLILGNYYAKVYPDRIEVNYFWAPFSRSYSFDQIQSLARDTKNNRYNDFDIQFKDGKYWRTENLTVDGGHEETTQMVQFLIEKAKLYPTFNYRK